MSSGYTITPVANDEGNIVDFNINEGPDGYRSSDRDYVELNDGIHHVFENVSIEEDPLEDYYETLAASDSRIPGAIAWAADNMSPEFINTFNSALDNDDVDTINEYLEFLLNQYPGDEYNNSDEEYVEDEDLTDDESEELTSVIEELVGNEPQGEEVALAWQEWSEQAAANGNEVAAGIAAATAAFNAGECDAETAIQFVLDNYSIRDIEQAYRLITNQ
jgi:hypothetical protein